MVNCWLEGQVKSISRASKVHVLCTMNVHKIVCQIIFYTYIQYVTELGKLWH